jgi:hypothetical protein
MNTTLTGRGTITGGSIGADIAGITITNVGNTINSNVFPDAAGTMLKNERHGVIETFELGNYTDALSIVNFGTIEGELSGGGNEAYVTNCNISGGGTIAVAAAEYFQFDDGGLIRGQRFSIAEGGTLALDALQFKYGGALKNSGTLEIYKGGPTPELYLNDSTTLSGGGTVRLNGGAIGGKRPMTLVNKNDTIFGAGNLGSGRIAIVNMKAGIIEAATNPIGLVIDCGRAVFFNAGLVESGGGILKIASVMDNTGTIVCSSGGSATFQKMVVNDGRIEVANVVDFEASVKGTGSVLITSGTLSAAAGFQQSVTFQSGYEQDGVLELADSQNYRRTIKGFEFFQGLFGGTTLDLRDVGFVGAGEATYSGTTERGVLTVTDGTHTASIRFSGDYLTATFVASSDGQGGVDIIANPADARPVSPHTFISAMAGFGAKTDAALHGLNTGITPRESLLAARTAQA